MLNSLKDAVHNHWPTILLCILGLIPPLLWFKDGLLIAGGDNFYYLDPGANFHSHAYAWLSKISGGVPNPSVSQIFPFMFFWVVLEKAGLSLVHIERLWAILLFTVPGFSIYYLVTRLHIGMDHRLAGLTAAVLYMFNPFVMADVLQPNFRLVQAALPITLFFWIKGLNQKIFSLKYPILIGIVSIFYASSNINLPTVSVIPIILFLYLFFFILLRKSRIPHALKFATATAVAYITVNSWWISTSLVHMVEISPSVQQVAGGVDLTGQTTILEAFRLMGFWGFLTTYLGEPIVPYASSYYEPVLLISTYLIPLVVFSVLLKNSKYKNIYFFAFLAVFGLFMTKGINDPFGNTYKSLYEKFPGFWVFREPFAKFTPITLLSYSVLLGYSVEAIYGKMKEFLSAERKPILSFFPKIVPLVVIAILIGNAYPLVTGDAIWNGSAGHMRSLYVKPPEYWTDAGAWLERTDRDSRVLLLPKAGYGHGYDWESGMGSAGPVAEVFLPNPLVSYPFVSSSQSARLIEKLYGMVDLNTSTNIAPFLALFNVKYVLQQNDLDWKHGLYFSSPSPTEMKGFLANQPGIVFNRSFGRLDLYQVKEEYLLPHIYVPEEVTYSIGNDSLKDIITFSGSKVKNAIFTESDLQENQKNVALQNADVLFIKVSPVQFSRNIVEYNFELPRNSTYNIYLNVRDDTAKEIENFSLEFDGKGVKIDYDNGEIGRSSEYKLWSYEFRGLMPCAECGNVAREVFTFYIPPAALEYDPEKDAILVDNRSVANVSSIYFNTSSWRGGENNSIYVGFPAENVKTLSLSGGWKFIQDDGKVALYQTFLPESFPESLNTSPEKRRLLMAYRDGVLLRERFGGVGEALMEPDEITIGEIWPRRVAVSVPSGTIPMGDYKILFLDDPPPLPSGEFSIRYRYRAMSRLIANLSLKEGPHSVKLYAPTLEGKSDAVDLILRVDRPERRPHQPAITFDKIDPTRYHVHVTNATHPYYLVFSESYHPKWRAYIGDREVAEENHLVANGYANAWYVDEIGDYDISLEYTSQRLLERTLVLSGIALIAGILYFMRRRKRSSLNGELGQNVAFDGRIHSLSKAFLVLFMLLLSIAVESVISNRPDIAEGLAVWAYLSLATGVFLQLGLLLRGR
jgi:hypothetical protein